jgi:hypothetical protein
LLSFSAINHFINTQSKNMKPILFRWTAPLLLACLFSATSAQQNVGIGTNSPNASARLDITATNRGLLIPRVNLTALNDVNTVPTPANGLLVFNTNTALTGGTGFYYNNGTPNAAQWVRLQTGSGGGSGWALTGNAGTDSTLNFVGTTDVKPLVFRVNNGFAGQIGSNGGISLGRGANGRNKFTDPGIIAIGDSALFNNTDSSELAIGNGALFNNTRSGDNVAVGHQSMLTNRTGFNNNAFGNFSLFANDTGFLNVAIGHAALASCLRSFNTAVGSFAMSADSSGGENTAVGYSALTDNFTGNANTAVGFQSLSSNVNGVSNTALGWRSLVLNTSGTNNVSVGWQSMFSNTLGTRNTAMGINSLVSNTEGGWNVALGRSSMSSNVSGNGNTAVGNRALTSLISGNFNTAIGDSADVFGITTANNSTAIGYQALVNANNTIVLGNASITRIGGIVGWTSVSDGRYKKSVAEDVKGLDFIMKLRPVTYQFDFEKIRNERYQNKITKGADEEMYLPTRVKNTRAGVQPMPGSRGSVAQATATGDNPPSADYEEEVRRNDQIRYSGFIAQEVEAAAQKAGYSFSGVDGPKNEKDNYGLRYAEFVVPLVKAVQEQQDLIQRQQQLIDNLTRRIEELEKK